MLSSSRKNYHSSSTTEGKATIKQHVCLTLQHFRLRHCADAWVADMKPLTSRCRLMKRPGIALFLICICSPHVRNKIRQVLHVSDFVKQSFCRWFADFDISCVVTAVHVTTVLNYSIQRVQHLSFWVCAALKKNKIKIRHVLKGVKNDHKAPWVRLVGHHERQLTWSTTSTVFSTAITISEMQPIFTIPKDPADALTGGLLLSAMFLLSLQTIPRAFCGHS